MENPIIESNYKRIKREAKAFYDSIGRVWCQALYSDVLFIRAGFQHLIRRKGIQRPKSEQKRRFTLLKYVGEILGSPEAIFSSHVKNLNGRQVTFHVFKKQYLDEIVTVVVRQDEGRPIQFLSVYSKKPSC
jgi:hypothetical protein